MGRIGTNGTDKTPNFIYFSILILIFENIISICENKFIYPFYPSHLPLSVSFYIPYLIRLKINIIYYIIYIIHITMVNKGNIKQITPLQTFRQIYHAKLSHDSQKTPSSFENNCKITAENDLKSKIG